MPPKTDQSREKLPEPMNFTRALVSDADMLHNGAFDGGNRDALASHSSFMDSGDAAFDPGNDSERQNVTAGVRATLIEDMIQENTDSLQDANDMLRRHNEHERTKLQPAISEAKTKIKQSYINYCIYRRYQSRIGSDEAKSALSGINLIQNKVQNGEKRVFSDSKAVIGGNTHAARHNSLARFYYGKRTDKKEEKYKESLAQAYNSIAKVKKSADDWEEELKKYHDNTYMARSQNYDTLFQSYYAISRELQDPEKPFLGPNDQGYDPNVSKNAGKDIAEYRGIYNKEQIDQFAFWVFRADNAYKKYDIDFADIDGLVPQQAGAAPIVLHQDPNADAAQVPVAVPVQGGGDVAAEEDVDEGAAAEEEDVDEGAAAAEVSDDEEEEEAAAPQRSQLNLIRRSNLVEVETFGDQSIETLEQERQMKAPRIKRFVSKWMRDDNAQFMGQMHLVVDEKGKNGAYVVSDKSAKIYEGKKKGGKATTKGFFLGNAFRPADRAVMRRQSEGTATGNAPSKWSDVEKQERLRRAIRRSDFFRHINAATISYYSNYDGDKANMQDQQVKRQYMARRDDMFSRTTIGQNFVDGTYAGLLGGVGGALVSGFTGNGIDKEQGEVYELYSELMAEALEEPALVDWALRKTGDREKSPTQSAIIDGLSRSIGIAAIGGLGAVSAGAIGNLFSGLIAIINTVTEIVEGLHELKEGETRKRDLFAKFGPKCIGIIEIIVEIIHSFMVSFGKGIPDAVNILVYIEDGLKLLIDGFGAIFDRSNYVEMRDMGAKFESALTRYQSRQPGGPVDELGEAVSQNAQSKLFATAARRKARNSGIDRSVDFVATSAHLAGTALMATGVASVAGPVLKGASSFISFLGKGLDRIINFGSLKNDIEFILGDRELLNTPKFRTVLKEETGINNENYIPDLAKVFAAIDTHVLLQNNSSPGEQELAESIANRILGEYVEIDEKTYKKLLIAVGAPSNWRNVLLESISS